VSPHTAAPVGRLVIGLLVEVEGFPGVAGPETPVASVVGLGGIVDLGSHSGTEVLQIGVVLQGGNHGTVRIHLPSHQRQPEILGGADGRFPAEMEVVVVQPDLESVTGEELEQHLGDIAQEIHAGATLVGDMKNRPG